MTHIHTMYFVNKKSSSSTKMTCTQCLQGTIGLAGLSLMIVGLPYFHFANSSNEYHTASRLSMFIAGVVMNMCVGLSLCIKPKHQTTYEQIKEASEV